MPGSKGGRSPDNLAEFLIRYTASAESSTCIPFPKYSIHLIEALSEKRKNNNRFYSPKCPGHEKDDGWIIDETDHSKDIIMVLGTE